MTRDIDCAGFTLVELVVVIVLLGTGASFGVAMLGQVGEHVAWSERRAGITREMRIAFERLARDVRAARTPGGIAVVGDERIHVTTALGEVEHVFREGVWKRDGIVWLDALESVAIETLDAEARDTRDPNRIARVRLSVTRALGDGSVTRTLDVGVREAAGLHGWIEEDIR